MRSLTEILEKESIRFIDGRYSDGFVDEVELQKLVDNGVVEVYQNDGVSFVRLKEEK